MRKLGSLVLAIMVLTAISAGAADSGYQPIDVDPVLTVDIGQIPPYEGELLAKSAVLMDALTGKVLFAKDPHTLRQPASITKIMTMLLVMEAMERGELALTDVMVASTRARETGGTKIFLETGDEITVEQAMIGMAVESANDAAVVVAEHMGGSVEGFVEMMNRRAGELGMENTRFANPSGLDEEGKETVTTAYDVALMSRQLLTHPQILTWTTIPWDTQFMGKVYIANKNLKFIQNYPGGDGLKTGWTEESGYCLSATALRGETRMISVVMDTPTYQQRTKDAVNLLDYGFAHWRSQKLYSAGEVLATVPTDKGSIPFIELVPSRDVTLILEKNDNREVSTVVHLPKLLVAPFEKGVAVGGLDVFLGNEIIETIDLVTVESVSKAGWIKLMGRTLINFLCSVK